MEFRIASGWPNPRQSSEAAQEKAYARAITDLLANHTLIVGQSRSGKSTVARRLIEETILHTNARVVILDPNADFVNIDRAESTQVGHESFERLWMSRVQESDIISQRRNTATPGLAWGRLSVDEKSAILGLSPVDHFEEYREFRRHMLYESSHNSISPTLQELKRSRYFEFAVGDGIDRYRTWLEFMSTRALWVDSEVGERAAAQSKRLVVVDLDVKEERTRYMSAARVLEALWDAGQANREVVTRGGHGKAMPWIPTIVVIDEAHLFAPPVATDAQRRFLAERIERFCDQGKKLNLFLILVTQQPGKLNSRVLLECNNRIILRMNEQGSLRVLEETYGGERGRYDGALTFRPSQGWGLIEGALLSDVAPPDPSPRGVRFERGRTEEGGGSPSTTWVQHKGQDVGKTKHFRKK